MAQTRPRPLHSRKQFRRHLVKYGAYASALLAFSLAIGVMGFHWLAGQPTLDALLNAAMLLGGMGPIGEIRGTAGKLFGAAYALYAGLVFIAAAAVALAPMLHRLIHKLHAEVEGSGS